MCQRSNSSELRGKSALSNFLKLTHRSNSSSESIKQWMIVCFTTFSTVFHLYQDDGDYRLRGVKCHLDLARIRTMVVTKALWSEVPFRSGKTLTSWGFESMNTRSAGSINCSLMGKVYRWNFWIAYLVKYLILFTPTFSLAISVSCLLTAVCSWDNASENRHLSLCLLYAILTVCIPFPFSGWGSMWHLIVSVSDHGLFIYFINLL